MSPVDVVHWNPRDARFPGPLGQALSRAPRKNNFGDLLGPLVVDLLRAERSGVRGPARPAARSRRRRLLTVGSILHLAHEGDTVWGSGVNGKARPEDHRFRTLDVRAVRGPRTREFLLGRGIEVPEVYGDPALLLPRLMPELVALVPRKRYALAVVPNLNEASGLAGHPSFVDPRGPVRDVLRRLAQSERVVGSSLHAVVVAEALGVPASLVRAQGEPELKYDDYFRGSGRTGYETFPDLESALAAPPVVAEMPWDPQPLLDAFPWDVVDPDPGA